MATVEQHYDRVLADVYAWMFGGAEAGIESNRAFFRQHGVAPAGTGTAVDLGAGCGFQSIPLAELGFSVTAIDLSRKLLDELAAYAGDRRIRVVHDDLTNFRAHTSTDIELIVCMQDTLLHLEARSHVRRLFCDALDALAQHGRLILTFRDLTGELAGLDRFLFLKGDENALLTCFLEYEPETVKVHDLVHARDDGSWQFAKSDYRKLRLGADWVRNELIDTGFEIKAMSGEHGLVTIDAQKPG